MKIIKILVSTVTILFILVLASCADTASKTEYYARFMPEESKIINLSLRDIDAVTEEIYFSVYDYMEEGQPLVRFDTTSRDRRIEELEESVSTYEYNLELNDKDLEMADQTNEYNAKRYEELEDKYGDHPSDSEQMELDLMVMQMDMVEQSKESILFKKEYNQGNYDETVALLEQLLSLPSEYIAPQSGYLLTLSLKENEDGEAFDIGTMIAAGDVALKVDMKDTSAFSVGQAVRVKITDQWADMVVYEIGGETGDGLSLKFEDADVYAGSQLIRFLNPVYVEISAQTES